MVAEKYNMTKSRKYTNVDYSTKQVSLSTLMNRGLVITDKVLADEFSWEPREIKNIYKSTYSRNKNVRHITYTNDDNSLSMSMVEVVYATYKYFIARLKACTAKCAANYTTIKNMLLSFETMINKIDQTHEVFYLGNLLINVTVSEKHIFVHFEGNAEELKAGFKENEINENSTILFDLNYDENVANIMNAITKIADKYNLLRMTDYKQKSFKSLTLDN